MQIASDLIRRWNFTCNMWTSGEKDQKSLYLYHYYIYNTTACSSNTTNKSYSVHCQTTNKTYSVHCQTTNKTYSVQCQYCQHNL